MTSSGCCAAIVMALSSLTTCSRPATASAADLDPRTVLAAASQAAISVPDQADAQLVIRYIGVARVAALAQAGKVDEAKRLAESRALVVSDEARLLVVQAMARAGDAGTARTMAAGIRGKYLPEAALAYVAFAQAEAGDVPGATATAAAITSPRVRSQAFGHVAVVQAERGDVPAAVATAMRAPIVGDRATALADIALVQARRGDDAAAQQTFTQAEQTARAEPDRGVQNGALATVLNALVVAGDRNAAERLAATLPASVRSFAVLPLAMAHVQTGDVATARRLYPDIERRGYAAVIFAVTGRLDAAWAATGAVGDPWDRIETLRTVGVRLARAGEASRADAAFAQAWQTAAGIGEMRPCALRKVAVSQAAAGNHAAAETTVGDIPVTPLRDRQLALREIADAEAEGGTASAAYAWAAARPDGLDRAYALLGVAEGLLGPHRAPQNSPRHARRDEYRSVIMSRGCRY